MTERAAYWLPVAGVDTAKRRAAMLASARRHFAEQGILEVDTPILSRAAVSDCGIESVAVKLSLDPEHEYYLHTSPEFCMKRLLAAGFPDVAQICKVFRDAEAGRRHRPEFTMIEWYRLGFGLDAIMRDTASLIASVLGGALPEARSVDVSYREAFQMHAGVDPHTAAIDALADVAGADHDLRVSLGDDRDAWLDLLMSTKVAPEFDGSCLTFVHHYPASQAALARLCPDDASTADRFEAFYGNIELANGYVELTDASEHRRRFRSDQERRRRRGERVRPLDNALLESLDAGLPPCAGVAVGFDRLLMIASGADDIRQVMHFPDEVSA